jgi:hypothetical protein
LRYLNILSLGDSDKIIIILIIHYMKTTLYNLESKPYLPLAAEEEKKVMMS